VATSFSAFVGDKNFSVIQMHGTKIKILRKEFASTYPSGH
jgi:hypothetical protein